MKESTDGGGGGREEEATRWVKGNRKEEQGKDRARNNPILNVPAILDIPNTVNRVLSRGIIRGDELFREDDRYRSCFEVALMELVYILYVRHPMPLESRVKNGAEKEKKKNRKRDDNAVCARGASSSLSLFHQIR